MPEQEMTVPGGSELCAVLKRLLLDDAATVDVWPHDDGTWWFHVDGTVSVSDVEAWVLRDNGADYDPDGGQDHDD